ncbi:MAG TPA: hypothetical protein VFB12_12400 [Ktedonobacteraceae bacterium]|nr:hypothetical protein [Ktedonobacteraceae bacterium]
MEEDAKTTAKRKKATESQGWNIDVESRFSQLQRELMWLESGSVNSLYAYDNDYWDESWEELTPPIDQSSTMPSDFTHSDYLDNQNTKKRLHLTNDHGDAGNGHAHQG